MAFAIASSRQHYWDALRAGLMLLGIPYHAAMAYTYGGWAVTSPESSGILTVLADLLHLFRMQAFFLIAGYFAALLLSRKPAGTWLASRFIRLGIPLVAAALLLNPLQAAFEQVAPVLGSGEPLATAARAVVDDLASGFYPWIRHLWFLIVLLYYCVAAAAFAKLVPARWQGTTLTSGGKLFDRYAWLLLLATCVAIGVYQMLAHGIIWRANTISGPATSLVQTENAVIYAPYFAFGFLLGRVPFVAAEFVRQRPWIVVAAVVSLCLALILVEADSERLSRLFSAFPALLTAQVLVSMAKRYADRPNQTIDAIVRASFVIYLVHQPLIILFDELFMLVDLPVLLKFAVTTVVVTAISYGIWLVVERSSVLNLLLNGILPRRTPRTGQEAVAR